MSTEIRVALVYEQEAGSEVLRTALANAGVQIAVQRKASALDAAAVLGSDVDAIVVNLDPELEELLDSVTEVLDSARQPVIFNDPAASSDLSGWDRARWLRHLSAKLKGKTDVTPPPPPGAQAIPTPVRTPEPPLVAAPVGDQPTEAAPRASAVTMEVPVVAAPAADAGIDLGLADLDQMFASSEPAAPVPAEAAPAALTLGDEIEGLDALFAASADLETPAPAPVAAPAPAPEAAPGPDIDLDALFTESVTVESSGPAVQLASEDELNDLDALFSSPPPATGVAESGPLPTSSELNDLDALFAEFERSRESEQPAPAAAVAAPEPRPEPKAPPTDWSLEPLEDLQPPAAAAPAAPAAAATPAPKAPSGPSIPAELEASLAMADLKLLDDDAHVPAAPAPGGETSLEELASFDLSGIELEPLEAPAPQAASGVEEELAITDIDFDFDLGNSVPASPQAPSASFDAELDDLDALFAPTAANAPPTLSLPDLSRVFVLGASIGGPEAIKAFLAKLPATVPAAFIVAQHMGSEFLEMMASQLDAATALTVRYPKAGERLRHGEVVVAPANEHLVLDEAGCVRLSAAPGNSPYNPSIDQLVRDAADRFGDHATLILFSGMGTDAVEGGRYLTGKGGQVWAQDRASCVIATMIDSAKQQGLLRFEGSPVQLAERVMELVG